jgi:hypothetical protein
MRRSLVHAVQPAAPKPPPELEPGPEVLAPGDEVGVGVVE